MIHDLSTSGDRRVEISAKVCVIGGGTSGIFLARLLRKSGLTVVIVEEGGEDSLPPASKGHKVIQNGINYRGADLGRSFGLGGTSVLWGGQMIPVTAGDMEARPWVNMDAWPVSYEIVAKYFAIVKSQLGLNSDSEVADSLFIKNNYPLMSEFDNDFDLRLSTWTPFKSRNFALAYRGLKSDPELHVWVNAAVIKMLRGPDGGISIVTAQSKNGQRLDVTADFVVIAAGALESTRLLLQYDEENRRTITKNGAPLGCYFSDHLSITAGVLHSTNWKELNKSIAPLFQRGIMRTPRLELSINAQSKYRLTSAFAHFTFVTAGDTGFDFVRSILRRRQGENAPVEISFSKIFSGAKDIFSMLYWRGIYRRLWIVRQAKLLLQIDLEQTPSRESRLYLAEDLDEYGRKQLIVDWRLHEDDKQMIRKVAEMAVKAWRKSPLGSSADLEIILTDESSSFETLYDVYHPTGTIRMGQQQSDSVVNSDLMLWDTKNCFVTSTAVFPTAGSANPGLTHLALTARLAQHIENLVG